MMGINQDKELTNYPIAENSLESYLIRITPMSKAIYWTIIIFVITAITILPFIYVDVSIKANGYFQSALERQKILSTAQGEVIYSDIKEGQKVHKGDTLLRIAAETTEAQLWSITSQIEENSSSIKDLEILTKSKTSELPRFRNYIITPAYKMELENFEKRLSIQSYKTNKARSDFERNHLLFSQRAISKVEYENALYLYTVEKEALEQMLLEQKSSWQNNLSQRREKQIILESEYKRFAEELNSRNIIAPLNGEVIESTDIQAGSWVYLNQHIATISPDGDLIAMCFISPKDIGMVYEQQDVIIQVDAFNYTEWGFLKGRIEKIPEDVIIENGSKAWFIIECVPQCNYLELRNGMRGYLRKGMTFNAMIILTRRSLFNLLFDKADKWLNPNNKRNQ